MKLFGKAELVRQWLVWTSQKNQHTNVAYVPDGNFVRLRRLRWSSSTVFLFWYSGQTCQRHIFRQKLWVDGVVAAKWRCRPNPSVSTACGEHRYPSVSACFALKSSNVLEMHCLKFPAWHVAQKRLLRFQCQTFKICPTLQTMTSTDLQTTTVKCEYFKFVRQNQRIACFNLRSRHVVAHCRTNFISI